MNIINLMKEYSIELNDVRWYLAHNLAFSLKEMTYDHDELAKYIESGKLEVDLYNLEEKYIEELQDLSDRNKIDDVNIREVFSKIQIMKRNR